jgi:ABC-type glycerol-3-phosphate transport system substrate-binding protein
MRSPVIRRTTLLGTALFTAAALSLTACGGGGSGGGNSKTVTIWSSVDQPVQDGLKKALLAKLKAQNADVTINWQKVDNINQLIITKIQAGDTPDIAFIPQPGVVAQMNQLGAIKPLDDVVDMSTLQSSMVPGTLEAGTIDSKLYGLLVSANVKGLVFYPKKAWASAGYSAPDSIQALNDLTDQIKSDGNTPWCMGIESDTATGWPATDWLETLFMKYNGADAYNQWVAHKIMFDSPELKKATDEFSQLLFTQGNTLGGQGAIASTNFGTAGNPMFPSSGSPKCWMYNQGSFITGFFPKTTQKNLDANVGVFGFPPATAGGDNPVEGGGDMMTMLSDSDNVKTVVKDLSETSIGNDAAPTSSFISPHKDFDTSLYPNKLTAQIAGVMYSSTQFLFDGSDAMPAQVGAGSFWKEMTAWISGQENVDSALKNIDSSWPSS